MVNAVFTAILQPLFIVGFVPKYLSEALIWNLDVSLHCPSFRDWRPGFGLGAFFRRGFMIEYVP